LRRIETGLVFRRAWPGDDLHLSAAHVCAAPIAVQWRPDHPLNRPSLHVQAIEDGLAAGSRVGLIRTEVHALDWTGLHSTLRRPFAMQRRRIDRFFSFYSDVTRDVAGGRLREADDRSRGTLSGRIGCFWWSTSRTGRILGSILISEAIIAIQVRAQIECVPPCCKYRHRPGGRLRWQLTWRAECKALKMPSSTSLGMAGNQVRLPTPSARLAPVGSVDTAMLLTPCGAAFCCRSGANMVSMCVVLRTEEKRIWAKSAGAQCRIWR
jgi:hypothetical protein